MLRPSLAAWIAAGLALDAAALAALWLVQVLAGAGATFGSAWAPAVGFVSIPWASHVLGLPALFGRPKPRAASVATMTAAYVMGAALLIPIVGFLAALAGMLIPSVGLPFWALVKAVVFAVLPIWKAPVGDLLGNFALILLCPGAVGASLGAMGALLRYGLGDTAVAASSDALCGFAAAVIAFSGLSLADMAGLFARMPESEAALRYFGLTVWLPLATAVGVVAFLPHLIVCGRAALRVNPPRATSASGAAPSAPCR